MPRAAAGAAGGGGGAAAASAAGGVPTGAAAGASPPGTENGTEGGAGTLLLEGMEEGMDDCAVFGMEEGMGGGAPPMGSGACPPGVGVSAGASGSGSFSPVSHAGFPTLSACVTTERRAGLLRWEGGERGGGVVRFRSRFARHKFSRTNLSNPLSDVWSPLWRARLRGCDVVWAMAGRHDRGKTRRVGSERKAGRSAIQSHARAPLRAPPGSGHISQEHSPNDCPLGGGAGLDAAVAPRGGAASRPGGRDGVSPDGGAGNHIL